MKICLLMSRRFAYVGHNIARLLQEKYGVQEFCGYVYLRSSYDFLKSQKDIRYTSLLLDEEIHKNYKSEKLDVNYLLKLEKDYGMPNLWFYVAVDRVLMSNQLVREYPYDKPIYTHTEMLKILQAKARAVISFLEKERPDCLIVSNALGGAGALLLYSVAKKMGIKIFVINMTGIKNTYALSDHYVRFPDVENKYKENMIKGLKNEFYYLAAEKVIKEFKNKPEPHYGKLKPAEQAVSRRTQLKFLAPKNLIRSILFFVKILYHHFTGEEKHDYSYVSPWNYFKDHAKRKIRNLIGVNDLYDKIDPKENFVIFPLQAEPETSLLLLAPYKLNQLEIVKQVAKSLPIDYKLYVKEHPLMVEYRPRSFYQEIKKIPNAKLVNPSITGFELLKYAKLVTTITGTLGWEALMFKKPTILFGEMWFNCLSFVKSCRVMEDLPYMIKEQLENFKYNEEELLQFISALLEEAVNLDFRYLWEEESDQDRQKDGLRPLADLLAKKIGLA